VAIADLFLKVTSQTAGELKGEARDADHKEEIDVVSWSWGARSQGYGGAGHRTYETVDVVKRVDSASTGLLAALANNAVCAAKLTVRKAGKTPAEYLIIDLEKVKISSIDLESRESELFERVKLAFEKITVTYRKQAADGTLGGAMTFSDDRRPQGS